MLKVRLQRIGKRGQAHFRVVVLEHTTRPKGEYLELLGSYNPHQKEFKVKKDRVEYWVSKGAQVSPTVNNLLVNYKIWDKPKMQSWRPKKKEKNGKGGAQEQGQLQPAKTELKTAEETKAEEKPEEKPTEPEQQIQPQTEASASA